MTRDDALEKALQVLREIASRNINYADQMRWAAKDALTEIQRGLWIESVTANYETETSCLPEMEAPRRLHTLDGPFRYLGDEPSQHSEDWGDK